MTPSRLALLFDYPEEGWPSMDLAAEMLLRGLKKDHAADLSAERVCPPFRRRATRLPLLGRRRAAFNADRLLNRFWDYPRHVRRRARDFDLFHVCDHSYAQLVHELPPGRAGVYCHDLDAFGCLLGVGAPRPFWFRAMARRCLRGLQKAAVVFHSTAAVRRQIEAHGLIDLGRLVHAPYGIADEFHARPDSAPAAAEGPFLLHVGSCIPRKRIDVLLDVFAELRPRFPGLRLVKVGADWSPGQQAQIERLGPGGAVVPLSGLGRAEIAALYRTASVVLLPSEAEGFGLPVVEALACGAAVVASDLPVLREVGGVAAVYCPVGDVAAWAGVVGRLLTDPAAAPPRTDRLAWAAQFSWADHARTVAQAYRRLLGDDRVPPPSP